MIFRYYCVSAGSCASFLAFYKYISPSLSARYFPEYLSLPQPKQIEWRNRTNSTLHAFLVSMLCLYCLIYEDEISKDPVWGESHLVRVSCAIVVGYMVSDGLIVLMHYRDIGEIFFLFHHVASIYAFCFAMTCGALLWFANVRLIAEFSTPFVNKRWFLDTLRYKKSSAAFIMNGFSMTIMFFSVRVVSIPFYWMKVYLTYGSEPSHQLGSIWYVLISSCIILDVINVYWFYKIFQGALKLVQLNSSDQSGQSTTAAAAFSRYGHSIARRWGDVYSGVNGHVRSYSWSPMSFTVDRIVGGDRDVLGVGGGDNDTQESVRNRNVVNNGDDGGGGGNNNNGYGNDGVDGSIGKSVNGGNAISLGNNNNNNIYPYYGYNYNISIKSNRPSIPAWPIQKIRR